MPRLSALDLAARIEIARKLGVDQGRRLAAEEAATQIGHAKAEALKAMAELAQANAKLAYSMAIAMNGTARFQSNH